MKQVLKKAIIIGGSKGIGKAFLQTSRKLDMQSCLAQEEVDTAKLHSVEQFIKKNKSADLINFSSGGPPPKFKQITVDDWRKYFNRSFLAF